MNIRNLSATSNIGWKCHYKTRIRYLKRFVVSLEIRQLFPLIFTILQRSGPPQRPPQRPRSARRRFPAIAGAPLRDYKTPVFCFFTVNPLRHIQRCNDPPLTVFYEIFFTQIYNILIAWHSKLCENKEENMYSISQIFKYAYRSSFKLYIVHG